MNKKMKREQLPTKVHRSQSKCACHKGKHVDSNTTRMEVVIMSMIFGPVYIYVVTAALMGWL